MYEGGHQTIGCVDWEQPVLKEKIRPHCRSLEADFVAPTGVDPVTLRFSVARSTN